MDAQKTDTIEQNIEVLVKEIMGRLAIDASVSVAKSTDSSTEEEHYTATIQTEESGLLIGHHGETLNSLQLLLGVVLFKKLGIWVHVIVDVGDYRKTRAESISAMVARIIAEVEQSGQPVTLPFLTPLERRMVHMQLSEHPTVSSESYGEGRDRRVTIKPRASA